MGICTNMISIWTVRIFIEKQTIWRKSEQAAGLLFKDCLKNVFTKSTYLYKQEGYQYSFKLRNMS